LLFEQFKCLVENIFSAKIKTLQIDGGTEFLPLIRENPQIHFHISCPYTPQQNELVERRHKYITELSLATMIHAGIQIQYWTDIFESVTFIINRIPSSPLIFVTPFHVLFNKVPDYQFFRVLGCICYPYTRPYSPHKLSPRSKPCVFVGYSSIYKGYKCLDLNTNIIYISRHVIFDENLFPFKDSSPTTSGTVASEHVYPLQLFFLDQLIDNSISDQDSTSISIPSTPSPILPSPGDSIVLPPLPLMTQFYSRRKHTDTPTAPVPLTSTPSTALLPSSINSHPMVTRAKSRLQSSSPKVMLATHYLMLVHELDPTTFAQASKEPH
jgi:hypothetical protein